MLQLCTKDVAREAVTTLLVSTACQLPCWHMALLCAWQYARGKGYLHSDVCKLACFTVARQKRVKQAAQGSCRLVILEAAQNRCWPWQLQQPACKQPVLYCVILVGIAVSHVLCCSWLAGMWHQPQQPACRQCIQHDIILMEGTVVSHVVCCEGFGWPWQLQPPACKPLVL